MRREIHQEIRKWGLIALMASLPFSLFVNSLCIGVLALNRLVDTGSENGFPVSLAQPFLLLCSFYFLYLVLRCGFSENPLAAFKITERKASFLLLPLVLFTRSAPHKKTLQLIARVFVWSLLTACLACLFMALINFLETGDKQVFFYHKLGAPLRLHAVYFSMLILMAVFLMRYLLPNKRTHVLLITFFYIYLVLLGSKLFILLGLIYISWLIFVENKSGRTPTRQIALWSLPALLMVGIFILPNPIGHRFRNLSFRFDVVKAQHIGDDVSFDGLSLRLLQARLAWEIASEEGNWMLGVGPDKAQALLDAKYQELGLYQGYGKENRGFLGYNFHNQFFETTIQGGLPALLLLVSLFVWLFREAWKRKSEGFFFSTLVFVLFCMSESVMERYMGVVPFVLFSSLWLLYIRTERA